MSRTSGLHTSFLLATGLALVGQMAAVDAATGNLPRERSGGAGQLFAVDAVSASDVWAVGATPDGIHHPHVLIEHWDGSGWTRVPAPHPRHRGALFSVSAIAADDVWASGYSGPGVGGHPLVLHWDGTAWTESPLGRSDSTIAYGISGDAPNDVWVVGNNPVGGGESFIEHWDGSSWSEVTNPSGATLRGVAAVGPADAWTAGYFYRSRWKETTVAQHWDGQSWTVVPTVDPHYRANALSAVSALPSGQAWAVGKWGSSHTLIEQWDGTAWSQADTPRARFSELHAVSAEAPDDVWAVGKQGSANLANLVLHWDGTSWSKIQTPKPGDQSELEGVTAIAPDDAWAVGWAQDPGHTDDYMWIEHWDGQHWTRS